LGAKDGVEIESGSFDPDGGHRLAISVHITSTTAEGKM
jgi:hypothetical protein